MAGSRGVLQAVGGVFAPGHLGELTQVVPFELVDAVLEESGAVQRRVRLLPSRVGVYLVLAMGLFAREGLVGVWRHMTAGLGVVGVPSEAALRLLRRRVGVGPLRLLFDTLAVPLVPPGTAGACYRGLRTVALDGCRSLRVPDSESNRAAFGVPNYRGLGGGYPGLLLMVLVETGTRSLLGAVFGPLTSGELACAGELLNRVGAGMLLLCDRGFDANGFFTAVAARGAQLLVRVKDRRCPPILARLDDGSYLTRIGALHLRVIDAEVVVTDAAGARTASRYRLLTTLTDHHAHPAKALVALYHERWEVESALCALRVSLLERRVLRSRDPAGVAQELWALLALYQALRHAMAAGFADGDPDRVSFTAALSAARDSVITASGVADPPAPGAGHLERALAGTLLPERRPRRYARTVKYPARRYAEDRRGTAARPPARLVSINTRIHPPADHLPLSAEPTHVNWNDVAAFLRARQRRPWRARELANALGSDNPRVFNTRLSQWAHKGRLVKIDTGTYILPDTP